VRASVHPNVVRPTPPRSYRLPPPRAPSCVARSSLLIVVPYPRLSLPPTTCPTRVARSCAVARHCLCRWPLGARTGVPQVVSAKPRAPTSVGDASGAHAPPLAPILTARIDRPRLFPPLYCECMFQVFRGYVASVLCGCCKSESGCCTCLAYVASVSDVCSKCSSKCFICFRRMLLQVFSCCKLQPFYLDIAYISHICCKCVQNISSVSDICCI
jgi:hypothetical protein